MLSSLTGGPSLFSAERWRSSRSTPAQLKQMFHHFQWFVRHAQIFQFSWKTTTTTKTQDEPVTTTTTNRPDSVATTPFYQEIKTMTPYIFHLLSDRPSVTSVSIYSKPIRHCLGVILLKEYIVILIYYYSYDDLWRWLNLFEINL